MLQKKGFFMLCLYIKCQQSLLITSPKVYLYYRNCHRNDGCNDDDDNGNNFGDDNDDGDDDNRQKGKRTRKKRKKKLNLISY